MGHLKLEKGARATHHASMEERVASLEQLLNDSADLHEALKGSHDGLKEHHATIGEQLETLKGELTRERGTREADIFELREILGGEKLARAEHHSSVQELIANEKAAREKSAEELAASHEAHRGEVMGHLELEK